jgi:hypothetical protein
MADVAHYGEIVSAARAGKHILVEKPTTMSARKASLMSEVCKEYNVKLLVRQEITGFSSSILGESEPMIPGNVGFGNQRVPDLAMSGGGMPSRSGHGQ